MKIKHLNPSNASLELLQRISSDINKSKREVFFNGTVAD